MLSAQIEAARHRGQAVREEGAVSEAEGAQSSESITTEQVAAEPTAEAPKRARPAGPGRVARLYFDAVSARNVDAMRGRSASCRRATRAPSAAWRPPSTRARASRALC
jgi:hypothetical protein